MFLSWSTAISDSSQAPTGVNDPNWRHCVAYVTKSTIRNTMPASLFDVEFQAVFDAAKRTAGQANAPFPSPPDWRDQWIYFLMVDRFNNKAAPPRHQPFDDPGFSDFQGGKFSGVMDKLPYLKKLGVGAIWLSPVLKNLQSGLHLPRLRHSRFLARRTAIRGRSAECR